MLFLLKRVLSFGSSRTPFTTLISIAQINVIIEVNLISSMRKAIVQHITTVERFLFFLDGRFLLLLLGPHRTFVRLLTLLILIFIVILAIQDASTEFLDIFTFWFMFDGFSKTPSPTVPKIGFHVYFPEKDL